MSLVDALVTGVSYACLTALFQYFINRLVVRPFDKRWSEFESWTREALKKVVKNSSEDGGDEEK